MKICKRERAEMLPGGSVKDLKVPRHLPAAGEFGYTSAKAPDRTSPPSTFFFYPLSSRSTSHIIDDADLTARPLWQ